MSLSNATFSMTVQLLPPSFVTADSYVKRAQIGGAVAKRIFPQEMVKIPMMNCQSNPLLSEIKSGRPLLSARTQLANFSITNSGRSKERVSWRLKPLTANASGIHSSETGFNCP
jgi:hypothetical protein